MLKELWKKWRIARLKAKARRLYIRANGWMDDGYDCGFQLADEISAAKSKVVRKNEMLLFMGTPGRGFECPLEYHNSYNAPPPFGLARIPCASLYLDV